MSDKRNKRAKFTEAEIRLEASKYQHRSDFKLFSSSAYQAARDRFLLDDVCAHMTRKKSGVHRLRRTDNNAIYIWQAVNAQCKEGRGLYKVGVTSWSLGMARIEQVSRHAGMEPKLIVLAETTVPANIVEKQILAIGSKQFVDVRAGGCNEFRTMTTDELRKAVEIAVFYSKQTAEEKQ